MSSENYPLDANTFTGGKRITPVDNSEGGPPLASLLNQAASPFNKTVNVTGDIDLSALTPAQLKEVNGTFYTKFDPPSSTATITLPDFDSAPDGFTIGGYRDGFTNLGFDPSGTDTVNGSTAEKFTTETTAQIIMKIPGSLAAVGWVAIGG